MLQCVDESVCQITSSSESERHCDAPLAQASDSPGLTAPISPVIFHLQIKMLGVMQSG